MNERKEPTLGGPSPSEGDARTQRPSRPASGASEPSESTRAAAARPSSARSAPAASPAIRAAQAQNSPGQGLTVVALLLALAGLGGSGFLAWQSQQLELANAQQRSRLEARIAELEGKLSMTEGEVMESAEAFKAKLVWADAEIRKLWGVAYDTNRKGIAANSDAIAALSKKLDSGNAKLLAEVKQQISSVDFKLLSAQATVDEQVSRIENQIDKLSGLEKQFGQLRTDLSARIKVNEEAVKSIDVYRKSVNRDLLELRDKVNTLQPK